PSISTLSLHDALPIFLFDTAADARLQRGLAVSKQVVSDRHPRIDIFPVRDVLDSSQLVPTVRQPAVRCRRKRFGALFLEIEAEPDRKSTRLNSSHVSI